MMATEEEGRTTYSTSRRPSSITPEDHLRAIISEEELASEQVIRHGCNFEDYDNILQAVCGERRKVKVKLLDGTIVTTEYPLQPHELITRAIVQALGRINQFDEGDPLQDFGSTRYYAAGHVHAMEPDAGFRNSRVPEQTALVDARNVPIPSIIIETALTESWGTMMRSVQAYFDLGVRQVVYFKVFKTYDVARRTGERVTQLFMLNFPRPPNYVAGTVIRADRVISFGYNLPHPATVAAILANTGVHPDQFVGYGRHNLYQRCQNGDNPLYRMTFPAETIWHNVPPDQIPAGANVDYHIHLFSIIRKLIPVWLPPIPAPPAIW